VTYHNEVQVEPRIAICILRFGSVKFHKQSLLN
jgi:hypothetical protein